MERKNTVLLTVIAVATLLVAVVGATFAYFTASSTTTGGGASTGNVSTAKLGNTTFTFNGKSLEHSYLNYPGGLAVFGSKAEFKKDSTDTNAYDLAFDLEISYINKTDTDLLWALYMVEGDGLEKNLDPKCELVAQTGQGEGKNETHYWYTDNAASQATTSCTLEESQKSSLSSTTMLAYGKFNSSTGEAKTIGNSDPKAGAENSESVTPSTCNGEFCNPNGTTTNSLKGRPLSLSAGTSSSSVSKYYYLVVQYPNKSSEAQQQGSGSPEDPDIQVTLKVVDGSAKVTAKNTVTSQS